MNYHSHHLISSTTFSHLDESKNHVESDLAKGAGYYGRSGGLHSFQYSVSEFIGHIKIQGALTTRAPEDTDWFTISEFQTYQEEDSVEIESVTGNFVWIRAVADLEKGTVNSVLMQY